MARLIYALQDSELPPVPSRKHGRAAGAALGYDVDCLEQLSLLAPNDDGQQSHTFVIGSFLRALLSQEEMPTEVGTANRSNEKQ